MIDGPTEQETLRNVLLQSGGLAARSVLVGAVGRGALCRGVAARAVVRLHRGLYALPEVDESVRLARQVGGLLCLTSAALFHRWEVKTVPEVPHILLPRGRVVPAGLAGRASWHRGDVAAEDISEQVATGRELTLTQCLRTLPDDEALAIADSALRAGEERTLMRIAAGARGPRAPRMRRLAAAADARAANPFESVLRCICWNIPDLHVVPQRTITSIVPSVRPDLVDEDLRIVIEADSFEWHGDRAALRRDARRYDLLVADGWVVLRFAWEDVMFDQPFVRQVIEAVVARQSTEVRCSRCGAA
jgi:very-short-patch-repair endonuclease